HSPDRPKSTRMIQSGYRPDAVRVTEFWNVGPGARLLRLRARELHHLAPLLGFFGDKFSEIGGRARERSGAQVGKLRLHVWIGEGRVDLPVKLVDDLHRRILGGTDAMKSTCLITRHELAY